jgi:hypothetical protein
VEGRVGGTGAAGAVGVVGVVGTGRVDAPAPVHGGGKENAGDMGDANEDGKKGGGGGERRKTEEEEKQAGCSASRYPPALLADEEEAFKVNRCFKILNIIVTPLSSLRVCLSMFTHIYIHLRTCTYICLH